MKRLLHRQLLIITNAIVWGLIGTVLAFAACPILIAYPVVRLIPAVIMVWALWNYWRRYD